MAMSKKTVVNIVVFICFFVALNTIIYFKTKSQQKQTPLSQEDQTPSTQKSAQPKPISTPEPKTETPEATVTNKEVPTPPKMPIAEQPKIESPAKIEIEKEIPTTVAKSQETKPQQPAVETKENTSENKENVPTITQIISRARSWGPKHMYAYGQPAPEFSAKDINGKVHKLSDYKGKQVLVILWATWCPPCKMEIPHLKELRKQKSDDELAILAISTENPQIVKDFVQQAKLNYTALTLNVYEDTFPAPYKNTQGIPAAFFVDEEGLLKLASEGYVPPEDMHAILKAPTPKLNP